MKEKQIYFRAACTLIFLIALVVPITWYFAKKAGSRQLTLNVQPIIPAKTLAEWKSRFGPPVQIYANSRGIQEDTTYSAWFVWDDPPKSEYEQIRGWIEAEFNDDDNCYYFTVSFVNMVELKKEFPVDYELFRGTDWDLQSSDFSSKLFEYGQHPSSFSTLNNFIKTYSDNSNFERLEYGEGFEPSMGVELLQWEDPNLRLSITTRRFDPQVFACYTTFSVTRHPFFEKEFDFRNNTFQREQFPRRN